MADSASSTVTPHVQASPTPAGSVALTGKGLAYAHAHEILDRKTVELEIERLVDLLDTIDGDVDLEPNGDDEGDVSWPERGPQQFAEANHEDSEDDGTGEPSLGWGRADYWETQGSIAFDRDRDEREIDADFEGVNEDGGDILDEPHDETALAI